MRVTSSFVRAWMGVEPSIFAFLDKHLTTQDSWHQSECFQSHPCGHVLKHHTENSCFGSVRICSFLGEGECQQLLCLNSASASFRGAFEGQLRHNAARRLSQLEGSSKCSPQMWPSFPSSWRMHRHYPLWPYISQDSLHARKKDRK